MRAGEVSTSELAELLSPSLFADERVVVLEAAAEAGKEAVALIDDGGRRPARRAPCSSSCTPAEAARRRWPIS